MTRSFQSRPEDIALLRAIAATPRSSGSASIANARQRCARELRALGYDVRECPFEFSTFPGTFATPLLGGVAAIAVGLAGRWGVEGARFAPLVTLAVGFVALLVAGPWLTVRGILTAPVLRERGVNLEATRPGQSTTVWLCAHVDTKSQPVPTLVRSVGLLLEAIGYVLMMVPAVAVALGAAPHRFYWAFAAVVTLVGALPVVLCVAGNRSPGALDNASGVATVIAAAGQLTDHAGVGVLLTDAEELGLAGARAWTRESRGGMEEKGGIGTIVLNCDGVDDAGEIHVMFTGTAPCAVLDAVARAAGRTGVAHHAGRMIPGILTDSVAFTDAELASVTFSRGSWRSLARVHSRRDDLAHLRGTGIAETATLMAATVREIGETH